MVNGRNVVMAASPTVRGDQRFQVAPSGRDREDRLPPGFPHPPGFGHPGLCLYSPSGCFRSGCDIVFPFFQLPGWQSVKSEYADTACQALSPITTFCPLTNFCRVAGHFFHLRKRRDAGQNGMSSLALGLFGGGVGGGSGFAGVLDGGGMGS